MSVYVYWVSLLATAGDSLFFYFHLSILAASLGVNMFCETFDSKQLAIFEHFALCSFAGGITQYFPTTLLFNGAIEIVLYRQFVCLFQVTSCISDWGRHLCSGFLCRCIEGFQARFMSRNKTLQQSPS